MSDYKHRKHTLAQNEVSVPSQTKNENTIHVGVGALLAPQVEQREIIQPVADSLSPNQTASWTHTQPFYPNKFRQLESHPAFPPNQTDSWTRSQASKLMHSHFQNHRLDSIIILVPDVRNIHHPTPPSQPERPK